MNTSGNDNSSGSMFNNNSSNGSISTNGGESSSSSSSSRSSVPDFIQLPILSFTIILAIFYTIVVLIRPTFRANKLNWFTINVCLTSALLSTIMLAMSIRRLQNESSSLPCRLQGFLLNMAASQMMYSHAVAAFSRFLTIVYATKHIFRSNVYLWCCIGFGWLIAVLFALPFLFVDGFACSSSTRANFLPYYNLVTVLILPITIVSLCNIRIWMFVRQSSRRVHTEERNDGVSHARDVRLLKTMIITFTAFVSGWTPLFLEQTFSESISISSTVDAVFQVLPPLSMLGDVILIIYINQPIRLFLWQLIAKCRGPVVDNTVNKTNARTIRQQ